MGNEQELLTTDDHRIDIYLSDIELLESEYIESLSDKELIYKPLTFQGLLLYIYNRLLINIIPKTYKNDYSLLNEIFNKIYIPLCFKYDKSPTIVQFCSLLAHCSNQTISYLYNGKFNNGYKANDHKSIEIVKSWYAICEAGLLARTIDSNSIGSMFALKSLYQYRDNEPVQIEQHEQSETISIDDIKQRYQLGDITKPNLSE